MAKLIGSQLSLIAESEFEYRPVGDWDYDELGTEKSLVPNSPAVKLGTEKSLVPNSPDLKLGSKKSLDPNSPSPKLGSKNLLDPKTPIAIGWEEKFDGRYIEEWKPKIGNLELKWVGKYQYWYWRYYDINGKKASIYLHKDYNKAVRKAIKIGVPTDAKLPKSTTQDADPQTQTAGGKNIIDIAQTAYGASRAA